MRPAVLYSDDLEPITIVDLPEWAWDRLSAGEYLVLPVPEPSRFAVHQNTPPLLEHPRVVQIYGEMFERRGVRSMMIFVNDEENALALRSSLLPGQRADAQRRERTAYFAGVFSTMFRQANL